MSLKWRITSIVVFCWFLPITLVLCSISYYSNIQINEGLFAQLESSAENAIDSAQVNIELVISDSKQASYDKVIETAYKSYLSTGNEVTLYNQTNTYLQNTYRYNDYINSTMIAYCDNTETIYYSTYYNSSLGHREVRNFWESHQENVLAISDEIGTSTYFMVIENQLYLIRNIVNDAFEPYAIIVMHLNTNTIFRSIESLALVETAQVLIDDEIIYLDIDSLESQEDIEEQEETEVNTIDDEAVDILAAGAELSDGMELVTQYTYAYNSTVKSSNHEFQYTVLLDTTLMHATLMELNYIVILLVLLVLPLILFVIYAFYKYFTKPIGSLLMASREIEEGRLGVEITKEAESKEFEYLFQQFNQMSSSMKRQVEQIYEEQEALQNAKIKALQSQINPHFLNNTLEVINWEVRLGEGEKATEMLEALSTMLSATMSRNESTTTHLKEEMMYVESYLMIISTRMGKRLSIAREIDESVMDYEVPLLILQPIIENAIEHGIANRISGKLIIRVYQTDGEVVVEVENDSPLSEEDKKRIDMLLNWNENEEKDHIGYSSLGIRNVNQRLKLIFGEKHCLTIENTADGNTLSQIKFPKEQN